MAHHQRGRPKSTRADCLLRKLQERQGAPLPDRWGMTPELSALAGRWGIEPARDLVKAA